MISGDQLMKKNLLIKFFIFSEGVFLHLIQDLNSVQHIFEVPNLSYLQNG